MSVGVSRVVLVTVASLLGLTGCETSTKLPSLFGSSGNQSKNASDPASTGSIVTPEPVVEAAPAIEPAPIRSLVGTDPNGDVARGKVQYRAGNYGNAEKHFRRAVEANPRDLEGWLGLAASYDKLKRFDLADRAYNQAIRLAGPTPMILNNQGYSYILRNDFNRARQTLLAAQAKDPNNPYIRNNLNLLQESVETGKKPE